MKHLKERGPVLCYNDTGEYIPESHPFGGRLPGENQEVKQICSTNS